MVAGSRAGGSPPWPFRAGGLLGRGSAQFAEDTAGLSAAGAIVLMLPHLGFPRGSKCTLQTNKRGLCVYFPAAAFLLLRETAAFESSSFKLN